MRFPNVYPLVVFGSFGLFCSVAAVPIVATPQNLISRAKEPTYYEEWTQKAIQEINNSFKLRPLGVVRFGLTVDEDDDDANFVRRYFAQEISREFSATRLLVRDNQLQLPRRPQAEIAKKMVRFIVEFDVGEGEKKTNSLRYHGALLGVEDGKDEDGEEKDEEAINMVFGLMLPSGMEKELTLEETSFLETEYNIARAIEKRAHKCIKRITDLIKARARSRDRVGMVKQRQRVWSKDCSQKRLITTSTSSASTQSFTLDLSRTSGLNSSWRSVNKGGWKRLKARCGENRKR
ncbi:hypothetical protein C8R42DRAFT_688918 [Lentinula raphanica]|nr:hypothetical protein C8R42DRAFT_688918 [Lentinula raphanica]